MVLKPSMDRQTISYIRTDDNTLINETCVKWIKKMNDCLEVCIKSSSCYQGINTHKICASNSPDSYNKLNSHFIDNTYLHYTIENTNEIKNGCKE